MYWKLFLSTCGSRTIWSKVHDILDHVMHRFWRAGTAKKSPKMWQANAAIMSKRFVPTCCCIAVALVALKGVVLDIYVYL